MIRNHDERITIGDIRLAMTLHRPVTIDYTKGDGTRVIRVVEPFEIVDRDDAEKRPFFRAMDRQSHDFRTFRFDRVHAYRVAGARGRFRVPRPEPVPEVSPETSPAVDLDAEWADWLECQYDPDAPIPYLPTLYAVPVDRLEDREV